MTATPDPDVDSRWLHTVQAALRGLYGGEADATLATIAGLPRGADRYQATRELGRGGMGIVWEVRDASLDRTLAMKTATAGSDHARRLLDEARIVARLDHPGVLPVHDIGVDDRGTAYLTMRSVAGRPLTELLDEHRSGRAALAAVLEVLIKVGDTLAFAHRRGVVHRDVKPANVMVAEHGAVYVVDWGLAATFEDERGEIAGTPAYMAPERATGVAAGAAADVYAVGAILYEALAGRPPYAGETSGDTARDVLATIGAGPPAPVSRWNPAAPPALVAVCELAMQRDPARRYPTAAALVADLRAFLAGRVVAAHGTGLGAELRAWVRRNRALSLAIVAAAAVSVALSLAFIAALASERDIAERHLAEIIDLSVVERVKDLRRRADDELWPAYPDRIAAMRTWLREADEVAAVHDELRARLGALPDASAEAPEARWRARLLAESEQAVATFLADGEPGAFLGSSVPEMRRRLSFAEQLATTAESEALHRGWLEARAAISAAPVYAGLDLAPQIGLLPLGVDPESGLCEFAHLQSGRAPRRDAAGRLSLDAGSGIVLVLLPGGRFDMGASRSGDLNPDPQAEELNESPVHAVELAPFFAGKFEVTQAQWQRLTGSNPSNHDADSMHVDSALAGLHPVETVSWYDARTVAFRAGLDLPTEAQWEYACRGGTTTPWWSGTSLSQLVANVADHARASALGPQAGECWLALDDGFVMHAPVGSFRANPFGLHDTHGNVWEWCRDEYVSYVTPPASGDGARPISAHPELVMYRGGAFDQLPVESRAANRAGRPPDGRLFSIGVRMIRSLDGTNLRRQR